MILGNCAVLICFTFTIAKAVQIDGVRLRKCSGEGLADLSTFGSIVREVASLRGKSRMRCASKCSELEACAAYIYDTDRCVLIGDSSLPGSDVDIGDIDLSRIIGFDGKRFFRIKLYSTLAAIWSRINGGFPMNSRFGVRKVLYFTIQQRKNSCFYKI